MRIGEVAEMSGVPVKTIRFWEDQGLLAAPIRTESGYRQYSEEVVERLKFIRKAQSSGLALAQIATVLSIGDSGKRPCEHVSVFVRSRLAEVESRIRQLEATRAYLRRLQRRADRQDPALCRGYCSIIE
jgi:DNA-binding transcriptional MerR regulator